MLAGASKDNSVTPLLCDQYCALGSRTTPELVLELRTSLTCNGYESLSTVK